MNILVLVVLCAVLSASSDGAAPKVSWFTQPSTAELNAAVALVRADSRVPPSAYIVTASLAEPVKRDYYSATVNTKAAREIQITLFDAAKRTIYECRVDVSGRFVAEVRIVRDAYAMITRAEMDSAEQIVRRFSRFYEAMQRRNIDTSTVAIDTWASGIPSSSVANRVVRVIAYIADKNGVNRYDRPIEGFSALVDLDTKVIKEWRDRDVAPTPPVSAHYGLPVALHNDRSPKAPCPIASVNDELRWGPWRLYAMIHAREGLTLYNVRYVDNGVERRVAHRISLSEMLVPYGDTSALWQWRNAFDVGEYGFGQNSTPLRRGADVPNNALLRGAAFVNNKGVAYTVPDALGAYERDAGIGWRHAVSAKSVSSRRASELVVQHAAVIGNYDYIVSYILAMDGTITIDVGLTGIMLPKGSPDTTTDNSGSGGQMFAHFVSPNVLAPSHQHFFSFRLDLDIDDSLNTVTEVDVWSPPAGVENPYLNAMMLDEWDIRFEKEGARQVSLPHSRTWRVSSSVKNELGAPTAYTIVPQSVALPYLSKASNVHRRASFIGNQLYVTRWKQDELYAAGQYPNQSKEDTGLPVYLSNDERLVRKDVVLWCTLGVTHIARPEDWPVMPTAHATLKMIPTGFFVRNPILDPPSTGKKKAR